MSVNIGHLVPIYLPGILPGCSKYIQDISEILSKRNHQITILTANAITGRGWVDPLFGEYSNEKEEIINGVRVKRLQTRWPITSSMYIARETIGGLLPKRMSHFISLLSAGPYLSDLKNDFQEERYEVIHVTAFPFALVGLVRNACRDLGKPFICTPLIHFEDPRHQNPLLWTALHDAGALIACSNYEKDGMVKMGMDPSKIHLIPMGINPDDWEDANGERFRRKYYLEEKKIILFAGTKDYNKGAIHLLQAVERVRHQVKDLILISIGLSTGEWNRMKHILPQSHLLDLGYVPEEEKKDAFDACNLFVMPSRYDSFGIVYLEAWRCGKPVIGARVGAIPEVIEDRKDGLLVEFGNVDQLVSAIDYLLNQPDRFKEMGEAGRKKVIEKFNWQKNVVEMEKVYQGAMIKW